MDVTDSGMVTEMRLVLSLNAFAPIDMTLYVVPPWLTVESIVAASPLPLYFSISTV